MTFLSLAKTWTSSMAWRKNYRNVFNDWSRFGLSLSGYVCHSDSEFCEIGSEKSLGKGIHTFWNRYMQICFFTHESWSSELLLPASEGLFNRLIKIPFFGIELMLVCECMPWLLPTWTLDTDYPWSAHTAHTLTLLILGRLYKS